MILARVVGRLYSTIHHPSMGHKTILVLDRLKANGEPSGASIIAVDTVGAGAGQTVLVLDEGNGARQILGEADAPIRSVVVGIVDEVAVSGMGHPRAGASGMYTCNRDRGHTRAASDPSSPFRSGS